MNSPVRLGGLVIQKRKQKIIALIIFILALYCPCIFCHCASHIIVAKTIDQVRPVKTMGNMKKNREQTHFREDAEFLRQKGRDGTNVK
ncbi:hypothetical protein CRD36_17465 [Paremcibacter congregatus]|uniref:Uncharacterized protein n=1 Tax=Paremcibacter congregatus TaxID=2043170 RepID=A0A2G4YM01_9PROT|nr:hypothetical protein CRD36_17465 [Paremcibacter congregatus]